MSSLDTFCCTQSTPEVSDQPRIDEKTAKKMAKEHEKAAQPKVFSEDQTLEMLLRKFHTFTWCWGGKHRITVVAKCVEVARKKVLVVFDKIAEIESELSKCDPESDRYIELTQELRESFPVDYHVEEDFLSYKPDTVISVDDKEVTLRDYIINYIPTCTKGPVSNVRFS